MTELIKIYNDVPVLDSDIASQIAEFERQAKLIADQEKRLKTAILKEMEAKGIIEVDTMEINIKYIAPFDREKFDSKGFRAEYPDLYDEYVSMTPVSSSVRIKVK